MTDSSMQVAERSFGATARSFLIAACALLSSPGMAAGQDPPPGSDVSPLDTAYVVYDKGPISLPLNIGLRVPSYNRVDGLVLPWGPDVKLGGERVHLVPTVTYRSHLGNFDPYLTGRITFGRFDELNVALGRSTFSNDTWIRSDLSNTLAAIGVGTDTRNYFRADRVVAEILHSFVGPTLTVAPSIGFLHEYAWSTGSPVRHSSAPWSFLNRKDSLKMRRINPAIVKGHTTSALGGLRLDYDDKVTTGRLIGRVEHGFDTPAPVATTEGFTQYTIDGRAKFPTFGLQHFEFKGHGVFTSGEAQPQRFAYLGGSSTLSTVDLLAMGGDRLLFVEGEYFYPLRAPVLPFVGAPVITLRYAAGSAGIDDLPDFIQNIGIGIGLKVIKAEYHIDPSYKETPFSSKNAFSLSLSLPL